MIAKEFRSLEHLSFSPTSAQVSDLLKKPVRVNFSSAFFDCKYFIYLSYVSGFLGFRDFRVEKDLVKKLRKKMKIKNLGIFSGSRSRSQNPGDFGIPNLRDPELFRKIPGIFNPRDRDFFSWDRDIPKKSHLCLVTAKRERDWTIRKFVSLD